MEGLHICRKVKDCKNANGCTHSKPHLIKMMDPHDLTCDKYAGPCDVCIPIVKNWDE